jgi:hypothetical protein
MSNGENIFSLFVSFVYRVFKRGTCSGITAVGCGNRRERENNLFIFSNLSEGFSMKRICILLALAAILAGNVWADVSGQVLGTIGGKIQLDDTDKSAWLINAGGIGLSLSGSSGEVSGGFGLDGGGLGCLGIRRVESRRL